MKRTHAGQILIEAMIATLLLVVMVPTFWVPAARWVKQALSTQESWQKMILEYQQSDDLKGHLHIEEETGHGFPKIRQSTQLD